MFEGVASVHFVGIGGIGVSALAKFFVRRGCRVSGSDITPSSITEELSALRVTIKLGHAVEHLPESLDLLVYSPAVPEGNVERAAARERGIRELSYPEALGELSRGYSTIAVCGTNGKSTTTAMLGLILVEAGYDPTIIVGAKVPAFPDGNFRMGKGRFLVVEACEYREHFFQLSPEMIVVTNIEEDHLDYFRDLAHIRDAFQKFVGKLQGTGMVVWNANDAESRRLELGRGVSYGFETVAEYIARGRRMEKDRQTCDVFRADGLEERLGELSLHVPGQFNLMNALAAGAAASELGIPFETIRRVLENFRGVWRRFEHLGVWKGADLFSDYGHHPTAIAATLSAAREFFPSRRLVLCFQPHQHARTKTLFAGFVEAVAGADVLILPEIYEVAGRDESHDVSSRDLVEAVNRAHPGKDAQYARDLAHAESMLRDLVEPGDVLLLQGAGDIDELARRLA
jgi:UDP-N-acetylmuramate--alanine ligase